MGVWDYDLWQEIYDIPDPLVRNVVVSIYRLILDMRESDVLAQKVADKVNRRDTVRLTLFQKGIGILVALVAVAGGIKGLVS